MSLKKIYTCNICKDKIDNPSHSFGVRFSNLRDFTLGGYACTDGTHICYGCARQLKEHLNSPEIAKIITTNAADNDKAQVERCPYCDQLTFNNPCGHCNVCR